jgi:AI-2 transport protein TqsA
MLRALVISASLIIILAGIKVASAIVVPFLLALFFATLLTPVFFRLSRAGLPAALALTLVIIALAAFIGLSMTILRSSLIEFSAKLPFYETRLRAELQVMFDWLAGLGVQSDDLPLEEIFSMRSAVSYLGRVAQSLTSLLGQGFIVFLIAVFMLVEASGFRAKIGSLGGSSDSKLKMIENVLAAVRGYISVKAIMSLLTGVAVSFWLFVLGVDSYLFMGLLAFFLNFIPNIGSFIAAIPGILLAFAIHGPVTAAVVAAGYLVINVSVSNVLEPKYIGNRLGISPLIVLLSLVFWGWLLGPAGMLLSVPLTMVVKIGLENSDQTRSLAVLLGSPPARSSDGDQN